MTTPRCQVERRSEVRCAAVPERICWARDGARKVHAGWVRDAAASGLAFVTPTRDQPAPGDELELTFGAGGPSPRYRRIRVMHTGPHDRFFSVVGCRLTPTAERTQPT